MWTALRANLIRVSGVTGAVLTALLLSSGAMAQCTNNTGVVLASGASPNLVYPFAIGTSLNSLLSTINTVNTAFLTNTVAFASAPGGAAPDQQGGGVWSRTVAGYADTQATTVGLLSSPLATGPFTCTGTVHEEYVGAQFGFDLFKLNLQGSGANVHLGITGGYFGSNAKDTTVFEPSIYTSAAYLFPVPNFSARSDIPFVGVYGVYTQGGFFADAQVRFDLFKNAITDQSSNVSNQSVDARGLSVTGNIGYRASLGSDWFIEPSIGGIWSRVKVDDLRTNGIFPVDVAPPHNPIALLFGKGVVHIDDIESILGRASLRVGTSVTSGTLVWQPFATASVLREFAKNATATSEIAAGDSLSLSTDRVGTYAQFGLGTGVAFGNSGWLGYGRVDYKTGENVEGVNVNTGLRYQW